LDFLYTCEEDDVACASTGIVVDAGVGSRDVDDDRPT
jgi:hypothetical protein